MQIPLSSASQPPPLVLDEHPAAEVALAAPGGRDHLLLFYRDDAYLTRMVGDYLAHGDAVGDTLVLVMTAPHREALLGHLAGVGVDVVSAFVRGRLVVYDADEGLARFMVGELPDWERFADFVGGLIADAKGPVRAFGEMVDVLWARGNRHGALQLEEMWCRFARTRALALLCAYRVGDFHHESEHGVGPGLRDVCLTHTHVLPLQDDRAMHALQSMLDQRVRTRVGVPRPSERTPAQLEADRARCEEEELLAALASPATVAQLLRRHGG